MLRFLLLTWACLLPTAAFAVIIDSGDGSGNTGPPFAGPGWDNVGLRGDLTAIYLGEGWVLTAFHVGAGPVTLGGTSYSMVPGTDVVIQNGDGTGADLMMFGITPEPPLPTLPLANETPYLGKFVVMVGNGHDRGVGDTCLEQPPPTEGYGWGAGRTLRWGTNFVETYRLIATLTQITTGYGVYFDQGGSAHEAQGVNGDSGGAVFTQEGSDWVLSGVMIARELARFDDEICTRDGSTAFYEDITLVGDVAVYRDEILDVMAMPEPAGSLVPGVTLLAALRLRKRPRR